MCKAYNPEILLLGILSYFKKMIKQLQIDLCTLMFIKSTAHKNQKEETTQPMIVHQLMNG